MSNILVIAPHPDDETLGCGGTLLRHIAEGDKVHWLIMTTISDEVDYSEKQIYTRSLEIPKVSSAYGFSSVYQLDFITTMLDTYRRSELILNVSNIIKKLKPEIVYINYRDDVHSDHEIVFDTVASCTKSFRYPYIKKVRAYETLSETEFGIRPNSLGFRPNLWVNISAYIDRKIEIMNIYESEVDHHPFPRGERNIRSLAAYRGATAGVDSAEAFISLKEYV